MKDDKMKDIAYALKRIIQLELENEKLKENLKKARMFPSFRFLNSFGEMN